MYASSGSSKRVLNQSTCGCVPLMLRVPAPPGTMITSKSGALSRVCVGRTNSVKFCDSQLDMPWYTPLMIVRSTLTGSRLVEISERVMLCVIDNKLRAPRGPKTSIDVNAGNNKNPMRIGAIASCKSIYTTNSQYWNASVLVAFTIVIPRLKYPR
ncbi:hypothetical protein ACMFMF_011968 [Clarireedia jacksonii]